VIDLPETLVWKHLRRLAELAGVEAIALRRSGGRGDAGAPQFADLTWKGGEIESVRLPASDDPDDLARALARELGVAL
jgi:hypothetical protein